MLSFLKSKPKQYLPFPITTDIHSHILPGIDDGAQDVESSIELIQGMKQLGITTAIATPHIKSDTYPNTEESISAAYVLLQAELKKKSIDFKVGYAAEYLMDDVFFNRIRNNEPLLCLSGKHLLVEFSFAVPPMYMEKMAYEILMAGYVPVLAHPERYVYFHDQYKTYHRLEELGFLLQVNLLSTVGFHGTAIQKAAKHIIANDLVSFVATDLHHTKGLQALIDGSQEISNAVGKSFNENIDISSLKS